jgi:hypothetical protein
MIDGKATFGVRWVMMIRNDGVDCAWQFMLSMFMLGSGLVRWDTAVPVLERNDSSLVHSHAYVVVGKNKRSGHDHFGQSQLPCRCKRRRPASVLRTCKGHFPCLIL